MIYVVRVGRDPSLWRYLSLRQNGINLGRWLGDNPLRLDYTEFRNQHRCILPLKFYIKHIIQIIETKGFAFVCYHMVWVPTALSVYNLI